MPRGSPCTGSSRTPRRPPIATARAPTTGRPCPGQRAPDAGVTGTLGVITRSRRGQAGHLERSPAVHLRRRHRPGDGQGQRAQPVRRGLARHRPVRGGRAQALAAAEATDRLRHAVTAGPRRVPRPAACSKPAGTAWPGSARLKAWGTGYCTWTSTSSSRPLRCCGIPGCVAVPWWSAATGTRPSAASWPPRPMRRAPTACIQDCRCAPRCGAAPTRCSCRWTSRPTRRCPPRSWPLCGSSTRWWR